MLATFAILAIITAGVTSQENNMALAQSSDAKDINIAFLSDYGRVDVFEYAVERFNQEQNNLGTDYKIKYNVANIEDGDDIVSIITNLSNDGYTYFVGPFFSYNAEKATIYANGQDDMVIISPSSTAPALAKVDSLFRLVPTDLSQAPEIAEHLKSNNKEHVIVLYRDDIWGNGLLQAMKSEYGSNIKHEIRLDKNHTLNNHADVAEDVKNKVANLASTYGADKVAILLITFNDNTINLVKSAMADSQTAEVLSRVQWYGTDGVANSDSLIGDPLVAEFLASVKFAATVFTPGKNMVNQNLASVGFASDASYRASLYDAVFLLADTVIVNNEEKSINPDSTVRSLVLDVANGLEGHDHHHTSRTVGDGALGKYTLNEYGDLESPLNYPIYVIQETSTGMFEWQDVSTPIAKICR